MFLELSGIGNRERNSLTSKPKKTIPPKKNKKFGSTKTGNNKKSPIAQLNTINALNATPLRPQRPTSDEDDLAAGFAIQELTATYLLRKSRDLIQKNENQTEKISEIQSKIGKLQRNAYEKYQVIDYIIKEHSQELEVNYACI